ncbi:MAG: hypothetical protein IPN69_14115 [Acidobacteria bacterium]|nr:hypothetical protein [Acidobacteriota bacterium]
MKNLILLLLLATTGVFAQTETLTNLQVVEMVKSGLGTSIIAKKINGSENRFDVSVNALIELKNAGVDSEIIALMMEKAPKTPVNVPKPESVGYSDSDRPNTVPTARNGEARTIAIEKSSIHPSRQALEKELFKRKEWKRLNLSIVRYKESADFYVEIGFVPLSLLTHRYTFRIYDRRSGAVIAAGETTSWGSLAENLAREIAKKLDTALIG